MGPDYKPDILDYIIIKLLPTQIDDYILEEYLYNYFGQPFEQVKELVMSKAPIDFSKIGQN